MFVKCSQLLARLHGNRHTFPQSVVMKSVSLTTNIVGVRLQHEPTWRSQQGQIRHNEPQRCNHVGRMREQQIWQPRNTNDEQCDDEKILKHPTDRVTLCIHSKWSTYRQSPYQQPWQRHACRGADRETS